MRYKELIDAGFKRQECFWDDQVYLDAHGFNCFSLELTVHEKLTLEWSPENGKMEMVREGKDGEIIDRREINDDEMKSLIDIFQRTGNIPEETTTSFTNAA